MTAIAALGIGAATSLGHCIGMCGPLISTVSLAQGQSESRLRFLVPGLLVYHLGRVNSYAIIGLGIGLLVSAARFSAVRIVGSIEEIKGVLYLVSGLLMVLMGLGLSGHLPIMRRVRGGGLSRFATEHFMGLISTRSMSGRYLMGLIHGFLPCGPVYAVLMAALSAPTPLHAAGTMTMFGFGTIPVLLLIGLGAGSLAPTLQRRFNTVASLMVMFVGLEFLIRSGRIFGLVGAIKWGFLPVW